MRDKEIVDLWEAYAQVHEQETSRGPRLTDTYDKWDNEDAPRSGYKPVKRLSKMKGVIRKEEVDAILSHLLDEGYAETPEAAERIMVNMSEEWREEIMEGMTMKGFKENRKKLQRKEASDDAQKRGHVGKEWYNSGRKYSPDEAKRMRSKLDDEERSTRHRSAIDPEGDDSDYSANRTKNPKKLRKQKAMGEHD